MAKRLQDAEFAERSPDDVTAVTSSERSEDNGEPIPIAARRADALANVAETYMNNSETCTAKWYAGERLDWDMAVGSLFG